MKNNQKQISEVLEQGNALNFQVRNKKIVKTSFIGIATNVMLAVLKAIIGIFTNSIAITLDAVNNVTDAGSSVITIVGTKLAAKKPNKKHPYGYGRIEYMSAMLVGAIVMSAGISSLIESIQKIITPVTPTYSTISLVIIGVCVLAKIGLGLYVSSTGKKVNSESLVNSGKDALMDALISTTVVIAALIFIFFKISIEAWLGALISILIIKTGVEMLLNTISELLGQRVDSSISKAIIKTVTELFPEVHGVYDVIFNDYGPNRMSASLHIEVDDTMQADEISELIRKISTEVLQKHQVLLTAIGIYSMNTKSEQAISLRKEITDIVMEYKHVLQVHGFYLKENYVHFDVVINFEEKDPSTLCKEIAEKIENNHPGLTVNITSDADYSLSE